MDLQAHPPQVFAVIRSLDIEDFPPVQAAMNAVLQETADEPGSP